MGFQVDHLPEPVARRLKQFYRRKRLLSFARVVMATLLVGGVLALIAMHMDRFAFLSVESRYMLVYGTWAVTGAVALGGGLRFFLDRPGAKEVAYELESKLSTDMQEKIVSLEDLLRHPEESVRDDVGQELLDDLEEATTAESGEIDAASLVTDRWARYLCWSCLALVGVYGLFLVPDDYEFDLMLKRFAQPEASLPKPSFVELSVSPEDVVLGKGGQVTLQTRTSGNMPQPLKWIVRQLGGYSDHCVIAVQRGDDTDTTFDAAAAEEKRMSRVHRTLFLHSETDLQKSFRYRIRYADARTSVRTVNVIEQPRVTDLKLVVKRPEYTGLGEKTIDNPGENVSVHQGSNVTVSFRTDRPVRKRQILFERSDRTIDLKTGKGTGPARHTFENLNEKISFRIRIEDENGFENLKKPSLTLRPDPDDPPTVQMQYPTGRLKKVPGGLVPMNARIEDDLGVQQVTLQYIKNPEERQNATAKEESIDLKDKKNADTLTVRTQLDLGKTGAVPGDRILIRVRARDTGKNYGESRDIFVEVVPFTRGANERRRIQALTLVKDALKRISESEKDPVQGFAVPKGVYMKIRDEAEKRNVPLSKHPSVRSLLDLLKKEHHFTSQARYKDDVRRLYGILFAACVRSRNGDGGARERRATFERVAAEILPGLIHYRHVKNLTWRFFGMRYEANRIHNRLNSLMDGEGSSARGNVQERKQAITKRAKLYSKSLGELGMELIELSRRTDVLEEETVKSVVGELNTAAYYLRQGEGQSIGVRARYARQINKRIVNVLDKNRTVLPDLQNVETAARDTLRSTFRDTLSALEEVPRSWGEADAAMLHRNPFAPVWPQLLRFALSQTPVKEEKTSTTLFQRMLKPVSDRPEVLRTVRKRLHRQAFRMQAEEVRSRDQVSSVEKALQLRLLRLEGSTMAGEVDEETLQADRQAVREMELTGTVPEKTLQNLVNTFRLQTPSGTERRDDMKKLVREAYAFDSPGERINTLVDRMSSTADALGRIMKVLQNAGAEKVRTKLENLVSRMAREKQLMRALSRGLWLRFALTVPPQKQAAPLERLMLSIRQITQRYENRVGQKVEKLGRMLRRSDELQRTTIQAEILEVVAAHKALRKKVEELETAGEDGAAKSKDEVFVLLEDFRRTRSYVRFTRRLIAKENRSALARNFVKEFPRAGLAHMSENIGRVRDARDLIMNAISVLNSDDPAPENLDNQLSAALSELDAFRQVVSNSGEGDVQTRLMEMLKKLQTRIDKLDPGALDSQQKISSVEYDLAQARDQLKRVLGQVRSVARKSREAGPAFEGGPAGVQREVYRRDAKFSKERLKRRGQRARGFVTAGVLEAFRENPDETRFHEARNWSLFLYRLFRSELAGFGRVEREGAGSGTEQSPHLKFLRKELNEALKAGEIPFYEKVTRRYLGSVKDYLAY